MQNSIVTVWRSSNVVGRFNEVTLRRARLVDLLGNEYRPKCGDALRLGSKGRYGSFHLWINVWVAVETL